MDPTHVHLWCPRYLRDIVQPSIARATRSGLRSHSDTTSYVTPRLRTKFGKRAFSLSSPAAWNSLPADLRTFSDITDFKNESKTHVLNIGFWHSVAIFYDFWATVCKTVRPVLSVCLSVLSLTLPYCGQTAVWIKMPLGKEVGLGPGDIVLDGDPALPGKGHNSPHFWVHVCCGQTVVHLSSYSARHSYLHILLFNRVFQLSH